MSCASKPVVHLDILGKTDIRVGGIELVDGVPGSQKLVRLIVDLGDHKKGKRGVPDSDKYEWA